MQGSLFVQVEKTIELLKTKYLKAEIRYQGISRIEEFPIPPQVFREAILNAIAHKDYSSTTPIQISVYDNKIIIWNQGQLPENWTIENLSIKHPSVPYNPKISNALFRCGYIEAWGRGTINMISECKRYDIPKPTYKNEFSRILVELNINKIKPKKILYEGVNEGAIEGITIALKIKLIKLLTSIAENEGYLV